MKGFRESRPLEQLSFLEGLRERYKNPKRYKILAKSMTQIEKELDLQKLVHRGRVTLYQALGNLTNEQSVYVDVLSKIVVNESSDMSMTSSDDELKELQNNIDMKWAVNRMQRSGSIVDKTLLDIFRI